MNEYNSDQTDQTKKPEHSDSCTALVPDGESSAVPVATDPSEDPFGSPEQAEQSGEDSPPLRRHPRRTLGQHRQFLHRTPGQYRRHPHRTPGQYRRHPHRTPGQYRRLLRRAALSAGIAMLALVVLSGIFTVYLIAKAPDIDTLTVSPSESATCICDQDGTILRRLTLSSSNREIVSLDEIPVFLQNAVVAIEDERFFEHGGIDLRGIARAFLNGLAKGRFSEGASTITQQLIKNSVFTEWTQENSFLDRLSRKIQEQYLAIRLEHKMSKEKILENYLNIINFGSGCFGAQAASRRYFGKPVSELTLSESAVLAAIPQNPTAMNPITFPENNSRRRMTVLDYMEEQGYITARQHEKALNDNVYDRIREYDAGYDGDSVYTYYEDALIDQVITFLTEEKGCTYDQAYRAVYSGGLRIVSAQDQRIQDICDQEFSNVQNFPAGTLYGVDYALSISDADGIVTHYGQEHFRNYVRENFDPSFNLMCQDTETAQNYADAFREAMLAASQKDNSGGENPDGSPGNDNGSDNDNPNSSSSGNDNPDSSSNSDNGNPDSNSSNDSGSPDSSGKEDAGAAKVLAERLTFSPQPQASVVIIDQSTGFVRAIVGGRGEKTASLTLNRASKTTRQPGSTFKILTAYAPALDACGQTLATKYENQPYKYQDGTPVSNWDLNDYSDPVSIREAITRSINVAAVRCITEITPQLGFQYAQKFGISTLHEYYSSGGTYSSDIVQPLALGGITQGVSNLELCSAYAAIAGGGVYHKPRFFTQITDRHGNVIADYTKPEGTQVIRSATAWLLTDAMKDVITDETGTAYGLISAGSMPAAGKTGTTSGYKDIWFAGYTPYYTCCVWGGYDNNDSLPDSSSYHTYNKTLWSSIMTRVHASLPVKDFERPDDIVAIELCEESGLPAVENGCTDTRREFFEKGTEPSGKCPLHEPVPETETDMIYQDILDELFPENKADGSLGDSRISAGDKADGSPGDSRTSAGDKADGSAGDSKISAGDNAASSPEDSRISAGDNAASSPEDSRISAGVRSDLTERTETDTASPGKEQPQTGQPQTEQPQTSQPQTEQPQTSQPQTEQPQTSQPQTEQSQTEQSQTSQPQTTSLEDMIDQLSRYGLP